MITIDIAEARNIMQALGCNEAGQALADALREYARAQAQWDERYRADRNDERGRAAAVRRMNNAVDVFIAFAHALQLETANNEVAA